MYVINFSLFLKQLLPPPWRYGWQFLLIRTLLLPLKNHMEGFAATRQPTLSAAQGSMQVLSLRHALSALIGAPVRIAQGSNPFSFLIRVPTGTTESTKQHIRNYMNTYRLAGTSYDFEFYTLNS